MSNPFQTQAAPTASSSPSSNRTPTSSGSLRIPAWLGFLGAAALFSGVLLFSVQSDGLPDRVKDWLTPLDDNGLIFSPQGGMSREEAQTLYRQALDELSDGAYDQALETFKRLDPAYPGLQDMIRLHEAECYAAQGNEWAVQKKLAALLVKTPDSALKTVSLYRIGQSQFRGGEWAKAESTFRIVRKRAPQSEYALGSLYYLGALSLRRGGATAVQGVADLTSYLQRCPDCRFSGEAAELLERRIAHPTAEQHALIGLAGPYAVKEPQKSLAHLEKGSRPLTWAALGKAYIRAGRVQPGVSILTAGLSNARDMDTFRSALDTILSQEPSTRHATVLSNLAARRMPLGGDYVLWKLAEADSTQAESAYQRIVREYPRGDYTPESAWRLLWPVLSSGDVSGYVARAEEYLKRYPYARSAPRALFWIARSSEKAGSTRAIGLYERLLKQYPSSYYAFRAQGRLAALRDGGTDPGWRTLAGRTDYPPEDADLTSLEILPPASRFAGGELGIRLRGEARELQRIGAPEDVRLLTTEALGKPFPAVESWVAQMTGDRPKGMRIIRDALEQRAKETFLAAGRTGAAALAVSPGTTDERKLLYPVYFPDFIGASGSGNKLDPYLVQALMREESYFNEFAISTSNARGLMQLLPSTAQDVAQWESLPFQASDLFQPEVNIRLGSHYLAHLHTLFNGNSMPAVGAYNGGPSAMRRWVQTFPDFNANPDMFVERIPYEQSRDYIKKVFAAYWNYTRLYGRPGSEG